MATTDRQLQRKIMMFGMTVWIDPDAGKGKVFGIKYPTGRQFEERNWSFDNPEGQNRSRPVMNFTQWPQEVVIYEPGSKEGTLVTIIELTDLRIKTGFAKNTLIYECRIPLHKNSSHLYALGITSQEKISIGIETGTPVIERPRTENPPQSEGMNSGGRGNGGMRSGRRSGSESLNGGEAREPLSLWTLVRLHSSR
jgi:hypothetical protein